MDNFGGFLIINSVCGGTGGGLGRPLSYKLTEGDVKKTKAALSVWPSPTFSTSIMEVYNTIWSLSTCLLEHTDMAILADNEQIYKICEKRLGIPDPTYKDVNSVIVDYLSSMTATLRFGGM